MQVSLSLRPCSTFASCISATRTACNRFKSNPEPETLAGTSWRRIGRNERFFPKYISIIAASTLTKGYSHRDRSSSSGGGGGGGGSSNGSRGNKVCFIFTIPPAKYRPVFPRDIDISGVPGLLLLTPFLHWLGIYVFFLLFPSLAFPPLPDLQHPRHRSYRVFSASLYLALSSIFLVLLHADGRYSTSVSSPPLTSFSSLSFSTHHPVPLRVPSPRLSDNQSRTRISAFAESTGNLY